MKMTAHGLCVAPAVAFFLQLFTATGLAFEGRITATLTRNGEAQTWLYTIGTNQLRLERAETNWPHAKNLVALDTGAVTLVLPHNRSFVRLPPGTDSARTHFDPHQNPGLQHLPGGLPVPPGPTPGAAAASLPATPPPIGPTNLPGVPAPPPMPQLPAGVGPQPGAGPGPGGLPALPMMAMPMMPMDPVELKATGETTNLLGYACVRYELKQRGEVMEIWATDQLPPFQAWTRNQPMRFGPRGIEDQWGALLKDKKLFPLRAVLKFAGDAERLRFEVRSITPEKIPDPDGKLFQPPPNYHELEPLPF